MGTINTHDAIESFVLELLRTGDMLFGLAADLVEMLPADAYPDEEPSEVVIEMITGTIRAAVAHADERDVRRAAELMQEAGDRVVEHLRLALELRQRLDGHDGARRGH
jgi:hypothetical protein